MFKIMVFSQKKLQNMCFGVLIYYEFFLNQDDRNILKEIHEFEDLNQINFKLIKKVINEEKSNYESI